MSDIYNTGPHPTLLDLPQITTKESVMSQMNAVGWFDIFVEDLERATTFYQEVLGPEVYEMVTLNSST